MRNQDVQNGIAAPANERAFSAWRRVTAVAALALAGCIYDVPITGGATRHIDVRLIGDWSSEDGNEKLEVRELTGTTYLLLLNGDPFRAFHSDVAGVPFVTVQDLDGRERKYAYLKYALSADGNKLTGWAVSSDTVPKSVRTSAEVRRLLRKNLANPGLYVADSLEFVRRSSAAPRVPRPKRRHDAPPGRGPAHARADFTPFA
jgi:hypothetical protein